MTTIVVFPLWLQTWLQESQVERTSPFHPKKGPTGGLAGVRFKPSFVKWWSQAVTGPQTDVFYLAYTMLSHTFKKSCQCLKTRQFHIKNQIFDFYWKKSKDRSETWQFFPLCPHVIVQEPCSWGGKVLGEGKHSIVLWLGFSPLVSLCPSAVVFSTASQACFVLFPL